MTGGSSEGRRARQRALYVGGLIALAATTAGFVLAGTVNTIALSGQGYYEGSVGSVPGITAVADQVARGTATSLVQNLSQGGAPYAEAFDTGTGNVYVVDVATAQVSVISGSTGVLITTVAVGSNPTFAAYDSGKGEIFVSNANSNSVSVISDSTNTVVATIPVGSGGSVSPVGLAYVPSLGELFLGMSYNSNEMEVISDASNTVVQHVATSNGGCNYYCDPTDVVYDPAQGEVFATSGGGPFVIAVSVSTYAVTWIPVGTIQLSAGLAYDPLNGEIFAANQNQNQVYVINAGTNALVTTISTPSRPNGVAFDGQQTVYVGYLGAPEVQTIAVATNSISGTIALPAGSSPQWIAVDPATDVLYVPLVTPNAIALLSTAPTSLPSATTVLPGGGAEVTVCATPAGCIAGDPTEQVIVTYVGQSGPQSFRLQATASGSSTFTGAPLSFSDGGGLLGTTTIVIDLDLGAPAGQTITSVSLSANQ